MSKKKLYVSNSEESIRIFELGWMEALSKVHFSVPLFVFIPTIAYFIYKGVIAGGLSVTNWIVWMVVGLFAWTFVEYGMHRFIFHFHPTSERGKRIQFLFHGVHHDYPCDRLRLVLPPAVSIPLATGFYFIWGSFIPAPAFYVFFSSFLFGYLVYDMFHYAIHHLPVKGKLWDVIKTNHLKHHYVDDEKGYGVSSPLWDYIIRSNFDESKMKDSSKNKKVTTTHA